MTIDNNSYYQYADNKLNHSHSFLLPFVLNELDRLSRRISDLRIFDLGCGNGSVACEIANRGWKVTGVDPSVEGIAVAKFNTANVNLFQGSAYDNLRSQYGLFPVVISLEVVEHLYSPRKWASTMFDLLERNGTAIISTPYHGYLKNLALAVTGKMDNHFTALWDHGHIKFWSQQTLKALLLEAGFIDIRFNKVGRIPPLARSMIVIAKKR